MLTDADWCWLILIDADWCRLILFDSDWFWLILIDSDWSWLVLFDADWCWLMLIDTESVLLIDIDWCSNKVQPGYLLAERSSRASPVIFYNAVNKKLLYLVELFFVILGHRCLAKLANLILSLSKSFWVFLSNLEKLKLILQPWMYWVSLKTGKSGLSKWISLESFWCAV